jgi:hypothetical protein
MSERVIIAQVLINVHDQVEGFQRQGLRKNAMCASNALMCKVRLLSSGSPSTHGYLDMTIAERERLGFLI